VGTQLQLLQALEASSETNHHPRATNSVQLGVATTIRLKLYN